MSDSLWPCGVQPARLLCPWDSPGKNTGVDCHALFQGILTQGSSLRLWCLLHWEAGSLPLVLPGKPKESTTWSISVKQRPLLKTYLVFLSSVFPHFGSSTAWFVTMFPFQTLFTVAFAFESLVTPSVFKPNCKSLIWAFKIPRQFTSNHLSSLISLLTPALWVRDYR